MSWQLSHSAIQCQARDTGPRLEVKRQNLSLNALRWFRNGFLGGALALLMVVVAGLLLSPPHTNILLLGIDRRSDEKTDISRTDTMLLVSVDPLRGRVGMLSIPRDLWLTLPDGSQGRINTAHVQAELQAPGSGPQAAVQAVRSNFGVSVDRFVRVDFVGFINIIDAVGGIDVDVPRPLADYQYPTDDDGVQTVEFDAGWQRLDGERALAYARIRHGSSDFQRAERQQVILRAFLTRLLQPEVWPRLPALVEAVQTWVVTDLTPLDVLRLAPTIVRVGPSAISHRVIDGDMVQPGTSEGGGSIQLPVWDNINPVVQEMFGP